jgi:hypothetical protein
LFSLNGDDDCDCDGGGDDDDDDGDDNDDDDCDGDGDGDDGDGDDDDGDGCGDVDGDGDDASRPCGLECVCGNSSRGGNRWILLRSLRPCRERWSGLQHASAVRPQVTRCRRR